MRLLIRRAGLGRHARRASMPAPSPFAHARHRCRPHLPRNTSRARGRSSAPCPRGLHAVTATAGPKPIGGSSAIPHRRRGPCSRGRDRRSLDRRAEDLRWRDRREPGHGPLGGCSPKPRNTRSSRSIRSSASVTPRRVGGVDHGSTPGPGSRPATRRPSRDVGDRRRPADPGGRLEVPRPARSTACSRHAGSPDADDTAPPHG